MMRWSLKFLALLTCLPPFSGKIELSSEMVHDRTVDP